MGRPCSAKWGKRTVDGNGNSLAQDVSVCTLKSGNFSKRLHLEVFGRLVSRLSLDKLEVELVGFGHCENRSGPGVALC